MTERKKDLLALSAMLVLLIISYAKILFTRMIIRAPDIMNEFYWGVLEIKRKGLAEVFNFSGFKADWNIFLNSGHTSEGAYAIGHLLIPHKLFFWLMPAPSNVAWFIVLHLFFGAAGVYLYCRLIGTSRIAAVFGGLVFALAPENGSLINAGHVMKVATISYAPLAFYCFEKGLRKGRPFYFLATSIVLAVQFFNSHWQIAYYTCLGIAVYGILRILANSLNSSAESTIPIWRALLLSSITGICFATAVSVSILPITQWSKDTNRGVQSGSNQGKGGLEREEAMMWSLPPEEVGSLLIPGLFGLSRQEGGANPTNIPSYYWGRMTFTQTVSYMGLLPWLLLPLPLIFRRDRYTWIALAGVAASLLFSMGQYTPFYNFLYDHFPGINRFRVPKMMLFMTVMTLAILAARGVDLIRDSEISNRKGFRRYICGIAVLPVIFLSLFGWQSIAPDGWMQLLQDQISRPTRYEQGPLLINQRWNNLVNETGIAAILSFLIFFVCFAYRRALISSKLLLGLLLFLFMADVYRINDKFMFLVGVPGHARNEKTPLINFLSKISKEYRVLPMDGSDPMQYVSNDIPVLFTSNAVQQKRWQDFLDSFAFNCPMLDMLNVQYMVIAPDKFMADRGSYGEKFQPVYTTPDGKQMVAENKKVLPKAWLVPSAAVITEPGQILSMLQNPSFDPRHVALVESNPLLPMPSPDQVGPVSGGVRIDRYEGENVSIAVSNPANALLVMGDKYYRAWKATDNGKPVDIVPVDYVLRGVYLPPGTHTVEFTFDPWSFKLGKWLTFATFALFLAMIPFELRRKNQS